MKNATGAAQRWAARGVFVLLAYLVVIPILFVFFGSVYSGRLGSFDGFLTLDTYAQVLFEPATIDLAVVSLGYATLSTSISVIIGATLAWLLQRTDIPFKRSFMAIAIIPIAVPGLLMTMGWILILDANAGLFNSLVELLPGVDSGPFSIYTFAGMVWVKGLVDVPLVVLWLWPAMKNMDPSLEEAAQASGRGPWGVVRTVTLPLVRPALLAAFVISFISSLEDVGVPLLVGLPGRVTVFASQIYVAAARAPTDINRASVYSVILIAVSLLLLLVYRRVVGNSERFVTVKGKGFRPSVIPLGKARVPVAVGLALFMFVIVILPLLMILWLSLSPFMRPLSIEALGDLRLTAFESLQAMNGPAAGLMNSFVLGAISAALVMALALIVGWLLIRTRSRWNGWIDTISFAPIAVPGLVIAIGLMWVYTTLPFPIRVYGTVVILVIAYVTRFIPYGVRLVFAGMTQLHPELEEAAATSGASWGRTLRQITLPLLRPTILVGFVYLLLRGFVELPASLLLHPIRTELFSVEIYTMWSNGDTTEAAAYGVVAIVGMLIVLFLIELYSRRKGTSMSEIG